MRLLHSLPFPSIGLLSPWILVGMWAGAERPSILLTSPETPVSAERSAPADTTFELRGTVLDEAGRPVRAARIQVTAADRIRGSAMSDPRGQFVIRGEGGEASTLTLHVERLGYEGVELGLELIPEQEVRIELVPAPLPLPGVQVTGSASDCAATSPEALSLWERAAALHRRDLDTLGVATYTLARTDTLEAMESLPGRESDAADLVSGQRGSSPLLRYSWERRVEREGYAFPVRRTNREGSYASWSYAPLEADFAGHFLARSFIEWHHLRAPMRRSEGGWDVPFCPTTDDRPALQGRLRIGPDSLLVRAEWTFRTPDPDEEAGGWTIYTPAIPDGSTRLLPTQSLIWKRLPDGRVQRRAQWYEDWRIAPGDSVPFLPGRMQDGALEPPRGANDR